VPAARHRDKREARPASAALAQLATVNGEADVDVREQYETVLADATQKEERQPILACVANLCSKAPWSFVQAS
jgi:hypothetical protein